MPGLGSTQSANPIGSQTINFDSGYGTEDVVGTQLNGLTSGMSISGLSYSNSVGATSVKVIITLQTITPSGMSPNVQIDNGTNYYELPVDTTTSAKRLEFIDIPTSFLASFKIFNNTGVAFAAAGNTCTVYPM
jgi:hypothetical protein